ncbi:MAG: CopD family protein [Cycloclasticus sp.]|nr:hypothetical protein A9Q82_02695 [Cycloclasticus sp. 46_120_T64]
MLPLAISLHLLSATLWVGGMFFAYCILRPIAAIQFEPPQRLTLWSEVFSKFFPWVWAAVILLLATGLWLIKHKFGGMQHVGVHIHIMLTIWLLMTLIFMHIFFAPKRRLSRAVSEQDWSTAGQALAQIRKLLAINLSLGIIVIIIATAGRYLLT